MRRLVPYILALAPALGGCVERMINIRTVPEGATVYIDGEMVDQSPCVIPFTYYGTREIFLEKEGFRSVSFKLKLNPPWYQIFPLDFITELLLPFTIRDVHRLDVELVPWVSEQEVEGVLKRAKELREKGRKIRPKGK
jgi:hypothetical protein